MLWFYDVNTLSIRSLSFWHLWIWLIFHFLFSFFFLLASVQLHNNSYGFSSMVRDTWVQSQVTSDQRLKKWYLIPISLTLSNIRYISKVKWSNPRKGVAPSPTPRCSIFWKGSLLVALDFGRQLYWLTFSPNLVNAWGCPIYNRILCW